LVHEGDLRLDLEGPVTLLFDLSELVVRELAAWLLLPEGVEAIAAFVAEGIGDHVVHRGEM
jgi:hypothetical protein